MTNHDTACFEGWLENYATPEELRLTFEKQIEQHILWLSSFSSAAEILEHLPTEDPQ